MHAHFIVAFSRGLHESNMEPGKQNPEANKSFVQKGLQETNMGSRQTKSRGQRKVCNDCSNEMGVGHHHIYWKMPGKWSLP